MTLTPELLAGIAGSLVSVVANFFPKYEGLTAVSKQLLMNSLMGVVTIAIIAGSCWIPGVEFLTCDQQGFLMGVTVLGTAVAANQVTHAAGKNVWPLLIKAFVK